MKILSLSVAAAALLLTPTAANAQFFGGFGNSSAFGGLAGAGIGGAIGSNVAGSGNRTEGALIGAALGGLAGSALTSQPSRYGNSGFGGNGFAGNGFGAGSHFGNIHPAGFGPGFAGPSYGPAFGGGIPAPFPIAGPALAPFPPVGPQFGGASFVPGGFVNAGTFANVTPAPAPAPRFSGVTVAAPNVTLAPTRYGSTVTQDYISSPVIRSVPKVRLRRAPQTNVVVVDRTQYVAPAPQKTVYTIAAPAPAQTLAPSGPSIHADVVNINYGDNSQVGTSGSVNGSTIGGLRGPKAAPVYSAPVYSAPVSPAPIADLPLAPTLPHTVQHGQPGGSYLVNSSQSFHAPSESEFAASCGGGSYGCAASPAAPTAQYGQAGGSYQVTPSQPFIAPSLDELAADCATSTFGCAGSVAAGSSSYQSSAPQTVGYAPAGHNSGGYTTVGAGGYSTGNYSFCNSDKVYNDDGALIVGANTVCR